MIRSPFETFYKWNVGSSCSDVCGYNLFKSFKWCEYNFFRSTAHAVGIGNIYDRVLSELVNKMKEMKMDKTELGCLRAIILYNPGKCLITLI